MARHHKISEYAYASNPRVVPPLPHHSWALTNRTASERKISSQEAQQMIARFWDSLDV